MWLVTIRLHERIRVVSEMSIISKSRDISGVFISEIELIMDTVREKLMMKSTTMIIEIILNFS